MESLPRKLRVIYLPYLAIAIGFLAAYSFLNWLLLIKLEVFSLDDEVAQFWLPFALPWIPILIWLRPRLKALKPDNRRKSQWRQALMVLAWAGMAVSTMFAQFYLATATGELTHLAQISEIERVPKTKYYTVENAVFNKAGTSVESSGHYSGRYNDRFDVALYVVCPIEDGDTMDPALGRKHPAFGAVDPAAGSMSFDRLFERKNGKDLGAFKYDAGTGRVWLGTVYKDSLDGHLSKVDLETQCQMFLNTSNDAYKKLDLQKYSFLERLGPSEASREFEAAIKRSRLDSSGGPHIILQAHGEKFSERNGNNLPWMFGSFGIASAICFFVLFFAPIEPKEMHRIESGKKPTRESSDTKLDFYRPDRRILGTQLLIVANLAVFACMVFAGLGVVSFERDDLMAWGGDFRPAVLEGEVWRLVTNMFVHGGLMHLAGNLGMLVFLGMMLEPLLGTKRFLGCYFICGIAGSFASIAWHPDTVSVGASGAIMGVLGVLLGIALAQKERNPKGDSGLIKIGLFLAGYNLLMGFAMSGVDNAAHVGGLLCGMILGAVFGFYPRLMGKRSWFERKARGSAGAKTGS